MTRSSSRQAQEELAQIGVPAVDPLLQAVNANMGWISARASNPLSRIRSDKGVNGLLKALDNTSLDRWHRWDAGVRDRDVGPDYL